MGIDVHGDEERGIQEFLDGLDEDAERRSRRGGGGAGGSDAARGLAHIVVAVVRLFLWIVPSYALAAPGMLVGLIASHPSWVLRSGQLWMLLLLSPLAAFALAWRTDRWRRPIDRERIVQAMGVLYAVAAVMGATAQIAVSGAVAHLHRFADVWAARSFIGTMAGLLTLGIVSFVLRRRYRQPRATSSRQDRA